MAVDTSIYNALLRPAKSVAEYDAEAMQGQQNRLALGMERAKATDYQRGIEGENKLAQLLASGATSDQIGAGLAQAGFAKQALAYTKQQSDLAKTKADVGHIDAQTGKLKSETSKLDYDQRELKRQKAISDIAAFTDSAQALASLDLHEKAGDITPEAAAQVRQTIPQNPADFPKWQVGMLQRIMSAKDSAGQIAPDANSRLQSDTSIKTNAATNATSRANNSASVGASYANAAAVRATADATRDAARIQRDQTTEMKLGDDYRAQSKSFKEVGDAYRQINSTLDKATTSPAATLAAATKFMKLLDPGSVVRESELGMALAATGVFDRATNYFNTLQSGKVLTPNQVADFKKITKDIYAAAQAGQRDIDNHYTKQAKQYNLRPEMVVQDLGQNATGGAVPPDIADLLKKHGGK